MIPRPAWAEIDLAAIRHNVSQVSAKLTGDARVMAVVKANAYGHGDVEVARATIDAGATWCAVILVDEGIRLREGGIDVPILLLHEAPADRIDEVIANDLTPVVFSPNGLAAVADGAARAGKTVSVHLKIDTGLNRFGVPLDHLDDFAASLAKEPNVEVSGVFQHFAFADEPDNPFIEVQLERFTDARERLRAHGIDPPIVHAGNSAAALTLPAAHFDLVRVGIALYGLSPGPRCDGIVDLHPAMELKARAGMVKRVRAGEAVSYGHRYRLRRDATIVSIPLGYADGWPRALSGNAEVLIGGHRHPAVGTVTMDSFMVDIGDEECAIGDEIVLIGRQGGDRITADEVAARLGTINYEVVARISPRIPRVFHG